MALNKVQRNTMLLPQGFPIDAYVMSKGGWCVEIQYLGVGDWVLSRCEKTGGQGYKRITKKYQHARENLDAPLIPLYRIEYVSSDGVKEVLGANTEHPFWAEGVKEIVAVTAEHPFWVNGEGWVKARNLKPGQTLEICDPLGTDDVDRPGGKKTEDIILSGRQWQAQITSVQQDGDASFVYNIEVEDFHTYFVGCLGVWVHDKNLGEAV